MTVVQKGFQTHNEMMCMIFFSYFVWYKGILLIEFGERKLSQKLFRNCQFLYRIILIFHKRFNKMVTKYFSLDSKASYIGF